jgi:hypothetical protein
MRRAALAAERTEGVEKMNPTWKWCVLAMVAVAALAGGTASADDQPFALVNVVDLFELFTINEFDDEFDPISAAPSNWNSWILQPRLGTNPGVVTVDGNRAWIGGYYNGDNFNRFGAVDANRNAWYAALGVAEVFDIDTQSGFGGNYQRYLDTFRLGPGIRQTDSITGMDYDPVNKILYLAHDAILPPFPTIMPNSGLPWEFYETRIAAVDADPQSVTYGQRLWFRENPVPPLTGFPADEVRAYAGISVDPLDPNWLTFPVAGRGTLALFDASDPFATAPEINITDPTADGVGCGSTDFRGHALHPFTGEWIGRVLNGVNVIGRDVRQQTAPYQVYSRFIREPSDGGNGTADTEAQGDDEQIVAVGTPVDATEDIIGVGPNGVLDTAPGGDDVVSVSAIVGERIVGNPDGPCPDDPDGFPAGDSPQGQNIAIIPADNLVDLTADLIIVNNRPQAGAFPANANEITFHNLQGDLVDTLQLPCHPALDAGGGANPGLGIGIFDFDYDADSGTLVVLDFERRYLFVYKAQTVGGDPHPPFDFTRDGDIDLVDFAGFQQCFTGPNPAGPLSLNCLRMNADSDCDVDIDDFDMFTMYFDSIGGP